MRKTVVVILAIAIIGALGAYAKAHDSSNTVTPRMTASAGSSVMSSQTDAANPMGQSGSHMMYKDGIYTGDNEDTAYGPVQVAAVISGGQITDVRFFRVPDDLERTQEVTAYSKPLLKQATLDKQSAHIDFVSGATQTTEGYQQSLQSALDQALTN